MRLSRRFNAAGVHLVASVAIAALAAAVIFLLWYPPPFAAIAGGTQLFLLVMSVDVVAGPALTFVAASPGKPRAELLRDLAVIAVVQLAALGYGLYTVSEARPVLLSFEIDRFRAVAAADIDPATLADAAPEFRSLSWTGPREIAAVKPTGANDQFRSMQLGMSGIDLSMDPRNWRPFAAQADAAWRAAKPLQKVVDRYPTTAADAQDIARAAGQALPALRYLPLLSRRASWVVVLAEPGARIVGYLPVDGFF